MVICALFILGCSKDSPKPPAAALLTFPLPNSECTTGISLNDTTSEVEFRWQAAANTQTYELRVTQILTSITQTISTQNTLARLPLQKGAPYSWVVISRSGKTMETAISAVSQFYNAGSESTFAPFPATITNPKSGTSVFKDINNEVVLEWTGADVDNDIVGYELYFSTESPPLTLLASPSANTSSSKVSVESDVVYYWRIVTIDAEGNTSDSGIFTFKAL